MAQVIQAMDAREEANPWHTVILAGQVLLVGGLAGLYFWERLKTRRLQRLLDAITRSQPTVAPSHGPIAAASEAAPAELI